MGKFMNESIRKKVLFCLLAGMLALSIFTFLEDKNEDIAEPLRTSRPTSLKARLTNVSTAIHQEHNARSFYTPSIDIFGGITPATPDPEQANLAVKVEENPIKMVDIQPQVTISPPPVPAPPPFKFVGKLYGDDEYIVFLNYNGKNIAVKAGEVLFEKYKVEEIKPPTMTLVNLSLSSKETISIGEP